MVRVKVRTDLDALEWDKRKVARGKLYYALMKADPVRWARRKEQVKQYHVKHKEELLRNRALWVAELRKNPVKYRAWLDRNNALNRERRKKKVSARIPLGVSTVCSACRVLKRFCNCNKVEVSA